ncbi:class I SAM-dependent methyltransferase [Tenggerimyces flavus]|uniref:Class I SAM-dependent methyltransferase n=1 Tax=Tenggerimyces flavus TaxID=1708749 RepID=A0ABV7YFC2_9ACTN|nr:class I SAM-dependent methyltransferase [Tenggerimyces flavus]MBM7789271.1 2-polyprenyl-3-methyl-5-hydroxy-6-metoxy-1,4-benzoquinol methylase [Tenggerimyces flavus]
MPRNEIGEYDAMYGGEDGKPPPWEIGQAQPALAAVVEAGVEGQRVLDAGCGSGELSILLASKGHQVTAFDFSAVAIEQARAKAAARGVAVDFHVADALALPEEFGPFDVVFDSGLLHSLLRPEHPTYVATLRRVCDPGASLHLLSMSDEAEFDHGLAKEQLEQLFADGFTDVRIEPTTVHAGTTGSFTMPGWLLSATR